MLLVTLWGSAGCYYSHLAQGQARVLWGRVAIAEVLADPDTPPLLAQRLRLVLAARDFGQTLGLEVDGQYTSYLPWPDDRILTNLVVAEPGQIEARPFRFPLIGAVPYKGFFDRGWAESEAERFRGRGLDVCLVPVSAYSTLGFFDDPVSDPMLASRDGRLVETVLHELVHATVFLEGRPNFNEGAASFIGQEASVLFFANDLENANRRRQEVFEARTLARFQMAFRAEIATLYDETSDETTRARLREEAETRAREQLRALALTTYNPQQLADNIALNDACLALRGTYTEEIPRFETVLASLDGDLTAFIARLRDAATDANPEAKFFRSPAAEDER